MTSGSTETPITPPGWTFVVGGVICLLSLAYAVCQGPRAGGPLSPLLDRLARPLTVVFGVGVVAVLTVAVLTRRVSSPRSRTLAF